MALIAPPVARLRRRRLPVSWALASLALLLVALALRWHERSGCRESEEVIAGPVLQGEAI